jgi:hypothetical protein
MAETNRVHVRLRYDSVEDIIRATSRLRWYYRDPYLGYWVSVMGNEGCMIVMVLRQIWEDRQTAMSYGGSSEFPRQEEIAERVGIALRTLTRMLPVAENKTGKVKTPLYTSYASDKVRYCLERWFVRAVPQSRSDGQGNIRRRPNLYNVETQEKTPLIPSHQAWVDSLTDEEYQAILDQQELPARIDDLAKTFALYDENPEALGADLQECRVGEDVDLHDRQNGEDVNEASIPHDRQTGEDVTAHDRQFGEDDLIPTVSTAYPQTSASLSTGYPRRARQNDRVVAQPNWPSDRSDLDHYNDYLYPSSNNLGETGLMMALKGILRSTGLLEKIPGVDENIYLLLAAWCREAGYADPLVLGPILRDVLHDVMRNIEDLDRAEPIKNPIGYFRRSLQKRLRNLHEGE